MPSSQASSGLLTKGWPSPANSLPMKLVGPINWFSRLTSQPSRASDSASGSRAIRPASQVASREWKLRLNMGGKVLVREACQG